MLSAESRHGHAALRVTDTGEGIAPDALPHVFTRFFRADSARTRNGEPGGGIGLTIAKRYVEAQGGRIGVEIKLGRGSSFWFTLPLMNEKQAATAASHRAGKRVERSSV